MWTGKAEQVYNLLREAIESGELEPGQSLPEISLVEKTGFSRTPVREALRQLSADGLVEIEPRRAPTVSRISIQGTRELFAFRKTIESAAVSLLASESKINPEIKSVFSVLGSQFKELSSQLKRPSAKTEFKKLAAKFDELVVEYVPNKYIANAIGALKPHLTRVRRISKLDPGRIPQSIREHIELCNAISKGDSNKAQAIIITHLTHVESAVFRQLLTGESSPKVGFEI